MTDRSVEFGRYNDRSIKLARTGDSVLVYLAAAVAFAALVTAWVVATRKDHCMKELKPSPWRKRLFPTTNGSPLKPLLETPKKLEADQEMKIDKRGHLHAASNLAPALPVQLIDKRGMCSFGLLHLKLWEAWGPRTWWLEH